MAPEAKKRQRTANKKGKEPEVQDPDDDEGPDDARELVQRAPREALEAFVLKVR